MTSLVRHGWLVGLLAGVAAFLAVACGTASPDEKSLTTESPTSTDAATAESSVVTQAPTPTEIKAVASPTASATETKVVTPAPTKEKVPEATSTPIPDRSYLDLEIVTLLPRDAIPAILDPSFISAEEAWEQYLAEEPVLGVSVNGEHKAYSVPFLSSREIVNDELGGVAIAATW